MNKLDDALEMYRQEQKLSQPNPISTQAIARILDKQGKPELAMEEYRKLIEQEWHRKANGRNNAAPFFRP